jgi:hypothetical protein
MIEDESCSQIVDTPQADSIEIIMRMVEKGQDVEYLLKVVSESFHII